MSYDLTSLLKDGVVLPVSAITSRKQVLLTLSDAIAERLEVDARDIFDAVMEREKLGSTGVGEGVAIPHARVEGVRTPVGAFVRLGQGVDFDAIDEKPCDLIFMLLAPHNSGADHLRALAKVSRAFRHADLRDRLRKSDAVDQFTAALCPKMLSEATAAA